MPMIKIHCGTIHHRERGPVILVICTSMELVYPTWVTVSLSPKSLFLSNVICMRHKSELLFSFCFECWWLKPLWQQGWSSEPCDMHKYGTCASYLARSLHPCSCLCLSNLNMMHKSYYFSWLLSYFSWYIRSLWINLLNYEHRKCLTILWSPFASIVTILCWMKTHTSPSRLGLASKIVRYATSTTCLLL